MIKYLSIAFLLFIGLTTQSVAENKCGKVTLADMNWNSATLIAHVDKFILTHGYGCKAELVPGDTVPTATSMTEKGEPDIASEMWTSAHKAAFERGVKEKRLRVIGKPISEGGIEGFWVPRYMVDKDPSLATIQGVIKNAKLFKNPEDPSRSAIMGCPSGWGCQISTTNLYKALKLKDSGFDLIDPGSSAGLAGSISKAYERKKPWFGYYWGPTAILGKYDLVMVDFGSGIDEEHYINCILKTDCKDPKVTMIPRSPVQTVITEDFAKRAPEAVTYLTTRGFTHKDINEVLAWMKDNQADGDTVMVHFMKNYEKIWSKWVTKETAGKIKAALAKL